jgi:hypothetical protein
VLRKEIVRMSMTDAPSSDALMHLLLLIICLVMLGVILALGVYFVIVLPARQAAVIALPSNSVVPIPLFGYPSGPAH